MLDPSAMVDTYGRDGAHRKLITAGILIAHIALFCYVVLYARIPVPQESHPYSITDYTLPPEMPETEFHIGRLFFGLVFVLLSGTLSLTAVRRRHPAVSSPNEIISPLAGTNLAGSLASLVETMLAAIDEMSDGVMITDEAGHIQYVNTALAKRSGYDRDELIGEHARILKSGEHDPDFYNKFIQVIQSGKIWRGKVINRRKDGALCHEHMTVIPISSESEGKCRYVAVKEDVTHQITMEERLRQSQKMQTIGELSGGIAHDFNNLLTVILGNCNLLIFGCDNLTDFAKENIEEIMSAAERASSLTRRLLAFSRKQTHQPDILDLNDLVTGLKKMLRRLIPENISIVIQMAEHSVYVKADVVMLEQAIINLAVNARDAMPQGGELMVGVGRTRDAEHADIPMLAPGYHATITVRDTGEGMDDETKAHIFERFFTTKPEGGGTGIGLATVQEIVQQEKGTITVQSTPGAGTTFTIFLPLLQEVKQDTVYDALPPASLDIRRKTSQPAPPPVPPADKNAETILVVDDEASVLRMIERALTSRGYRVCAALTEEQLLEIWEREKSGIDLLLTDVVMPGRSGVEIASDLRSERPDLRVLCMSAYTDSIITGLGGTPAGMRFLQKPFTPDVLTTAVNEALTGVKGEGQVTTEL